MDCSYAAHGVHGITTIRCRSVSSVPTKLFKLQVFACPLGVIRGVHAGSTVAPSRISMTRVTRDSYARPKRRCTRLGWSNYSASYRQFFAILKRTSNAWMYVNVFIVVYVQEMHAQSHIRSFIGCARQKFQNFAIFGAKHPLAPMAFKHFTPNFERARTFTFVNVHILDVRERAPPATPTFGCARRNGKRPTMPTGSSFRGSVVVSDVSRSGILLADSLTVAVIKLS